MDIGEDVRENKGLDMQGNLLGTVKADTPTQNT